MFRQVECICEVCGAKFYSRSRKSKYCIWCSSLVSRLSHRFVSTAKDERRRAVVAEARRMVARGEFSADNSGQTRCHYCGNLTSRESGYCNSCTSRGYNHIHETTGRTNGWDGVEKMRSGVVGGWRGQRMMGGYSSQSRRPE